MIACARLAPTSQQYRNIQSGISGFWELGVRQLNNHCGHGKANCYEAELSFNCEFAFYAPSMNSWVDYSWVS